MGLKMAMGKMDKRITIEAAKKTQGATYGEPLEVYSTWLRPWASVRPLSVRQVQEARQESDEYQVHFQIHWVRGLRMTHRIKYNRMTFYITQVLEVGRRERLDILATTRKP